VFVRNIFLWFVAEKPFKRSIFIGILHTKVGVSSSFHGKPDGFRIIKDVV
jgi:hypothetical protein